MKIVVVSPYLPWPLDMGGNAAMFSTLACLSSDHDFTLVVPVYSDSAMKHVEELRRRLPKVKIQPAVCIQRSDTFIQTFRAVKRKIVDRFRGMTGRGSPAKMSKALSCPFSPLPPEFIQTVADELKKGADICQVEFAELMPLGTWLPDSIKKIFVHHQLHFVYTQRVLATQASNPYCEYLADWMRVQEAAYLRFYDAVITFSQADCELLLEMPGIKQVFTSPFPVPVDVGVGENVPGKFDGRFVFVGSGNHGPNRDGLEWLLREIWPGIAAELPDVRLEIIGSHWDKRWIQQHQSSRIKFAGFVEHLSGRLQESILLVPLRIGSGIRTKILAALAQGVPVISTSIGAEGLLMRDGSELLVRDESSAFVGAAVELSRDQELRVRLTKAGRAKILGYYTSEIVRQRRNQIYQAVMSQGKGRSVELPREHCAEALPAT